MGMFGMQVLQNFRARRQSHSAGRTKMNCRYFCALPKQLRRLKADRMRKTVLIQT